MSSEYGYSSYCQSIKLDGSLTTKY